MSIPLTEPSVFYILIYYMIGSRPDVTTTLSRCHPPRYCDFQEELVVDDGTKTLGLHLCGTCRERRAPHFDRIYFKPSDYYVYRQSHPYKIIYYLCLVNPLRER